MQILIAPTGFKESLSADEAAEAIAEGVRRAAPAWRCVQLPLIDGGQGFARALAKLTGGTFHPTVVCGPLGRPVEAGFALLGNAHAGVAALDVAEGAGLHIVPPGERRPLTATSRGVGELVRAALDAGATRILVGCGDSGVQDGGVGMAQALGVRLTDAMGRDLAPGGGALVHLTAIDTANRDPRLAGVVIEACVNHQNMLLGEHGVSHVFGPQKGATPREVELLEKALSHYAAILEQTTGCAVAGLAGGGASGGIGAALHALLGARLRPRYDFVCDFLPLDAQLDRSDLVITGEGRIDHQTWRGKMPCELAARAKERGIPVIALAGSVGEGAASTLLHGIDAFVSMSDGPRTLDEAITEARPLLSQCAEHAVRIFRAGFACARKSRVG